MKKYIMSILSAIAIIVSSCSALIGAAKLPSAQAEGNIVVTASEMNVVLPSTYEQYLALKNPSDIAVHSSYLAVSDNNTIYVYDRAAEQYWEYDHTMNTDARLNTVACLEFTMEGLLFFTDSSTALYILDCVSREVYTTRLSCSVFTINEDTMYYATITADNISVSEINASVITNGDPIQSSAKLLRQFRSSATPALAYAKEDLYIVIGNEIYAAYSEVKRELPTSGIIRSLGFSAGDILFTDSTGTLVRYRTAENRIVDSYEGDYSAFCQYGDALYVIEGASVLRYNLASSAFDAYEICSSSSGETRLFQATDMVLFEGKLFIADRGNKRVSLANPATGEVKPFYTTVEPDFIAVTNGQILVCNGTVAEVYDYEGNLLFTRASFMGVVMSAVGLYDQFYLVTGNNYHYRISADGEHTLSEAYKSLDNTAKQLAADVYGNLYVLYSNGNVRRYSEADFMQALGTGKVVAKFPATVTDIFTDFTATIFGASGNLLYSTTKQDGALETYEFVPDGAVYGTGYTVVDYAVAFDTPTLYLLCGDFVLSTRGILINTLHDILVDGSDATVFATEDSAEAVLLDTDEKTLFIRVDIDKLKNAAYFSYISHSRSSVGQTVVQLAEAGDYYVVAAFDEGEHGYTTNLVRKDSCRVMDRSEFVAEGKFPNGIAVTTNAVSLYRYPSMADALRMDLKHQTQKVRLGKSNLVRVIEEVTASGGYRYCLVDYTLDDTTYRGYVPASFLSDFDGTTPDQKEIILADVLITERAIPLVNVADRADFYELKGRTKVVIFGDLSDGAPVRVQVEVDGKTYAGNLDPAFIVDHSGQSVRTFALVITIGLVSGGIAGLVIWLRRRR